MTITAGTEQSSRLGDRFPYCRFPPRVGERYQEGAVEGLRFLILGESHYGSEDTVERERSLTTRVVEDSLSGKKRHRFVSSVTKVVRGPAAVHADVETLFNASAFYNYVQAYAGPEAGHRPTPQAWQLSEPPFRSVLAELRPDLILVCGKALWEHVRDIDGLTSMPVQEPDDRRVRSRLFEAGDRLGVGGMINHPASRGFRPADWYPRFQRYVKRAHEVKAGRLEA